LKGRIPLLFYCVKHIHGQYKTYLNFKQIAKTIPTFGKNLAVIFFKIHFTAICVQAQTANIFARLFTFETGRLPLETEMFHRSWAISKTSNTGTTEHRNTEHRNSIIPEHGTPEH
jgi:hypothetical protein